MSSVIGKHGRLCVGIDPHSHLLAGWGLPDTAAGARDFSLRVIDACVDQVAAIKPQIAFYERFGSAGYVVLEEIIAAARQRGLLVIADVKRGDIGTSVQAYADAWLRPGSTLESDAMTISAFQGFGSLVEPLNYTTTAGKGLFLLAATSNPEARDIQQARLNGGYNPSVAASIVAEVQQWNSDHRRDALVGVDRNGPSVGVVGSVGVVLGATLNLEHYDINVNLNRNPLMPVLAPGFGAQGAKLTDANRIFGSMTAATLVSESRSVLNAGPMGIVQAVRERADEVRREVTA
nr:orotidine-5'-phosphate decarboxylase [Lysinibacter cavernae]